MTTDPKTLAATDATSWERFAMLGQYYWPRLKWQIIIYPTVSVIAFIIFALLRNSMAALLASSALSTLQYLVYFAPLVMALRNDREIDTMLPVNGCEKALWLLAYFLIAVPVLAFGPAVLLSLALFGGLPEIATCALSRMGITLDNGILNTMHLSNMVSCLAMTLTCLWAVLASKSHRVLKGVVFPLCINLATGIAGAIFGVWSAMTQRSTFIEMANSGMSQSQIADATLSMMSPLLMIITIILAVYSIVAVVACWRTITRRQV